MPVGIHFFGRALTIIYDSAGIHFLRALSLSYHPLKYGSAGLLSHIRKYEKVLSKFNIHTELFDNDIVQDFTPKF